MEKENIKNIGKDTALSLVSFIPVLGTPLQSGIASYFNEKRLFNIESFIKELQSSLESVQSQLPTKDNISESTLEIVESVYDEIQKTSAQKKRAYFVKALTNTFLRNDKINLDEERLFVQILSVVPVEYLNVLIHIKQETTDTVESENNDDITYAAISFFETYGIVKNSGMWYTYGLDSNSEKSGNLTKLGDRFLAFLLNVDKKWY